MSVDFPKMQQIFLSAVEQHQPEDWDAYLAQACAGDDELHKQVKLLLMAHFEAGSVPGAATGRHDKAIAYQSAAETDGDTVGPYKLLQQIGEGGMGTVYMAEQTEPVQRKVALKLIKPGMGSRHAISRFEAERQALALMDHPHIAKVLDAGTTDAGLPYFVMELVRGVPITKYCDEHRLTPRARLELFIPVCQAVQHAHQKGIIHRDLKPSNVLVALYDGQPIPKVIDFGVAKATAQKLTELTLCTAFGAIVGTLEYMSPEQAKSNPLDIDTRSDIYSLGVLLYELLTGTTPFEKKQLKDAALLEVLRIIREDEPQKPSTRLSTTDELPSISANRGLEPKKLSALVRGELDWIVMKALEKDRNRRYETANGFALDIQRYLADEPVAACPPSAGYRLRKFTRRNGVVIGTAALVLIAILLGTLVSVTQAIRATRAEQLAQDRLQEESEARHEAEGARQAEIAQREAADRERLEATRQRDIATRHLYVSQMNLAQRAWDENNVGRAVELLESQRPEQTGGVEQRGWEWNYLWRLSHSELRTLTFPNGGSPLSLAFSPDGQFLLSGSQDGVLKTWSMDGAREIRSVKAHHDRIRGLAYRRDGKVFVTRSIDGTTKLWDAAMGRELTSFQTDPNHSSIVALTPDGGQLVTAAATGITIWDTSDGKAVRTLIGHNELIGGMAMSLDGRKLFSLSWDQTAAMWDLSTGEKLRTFEGHKSDGTAIAVSPDGRLLVSGWRNGAMKSWDTETGQESTAFHGHRNLISRLRFSADGKRLVSASDDTTIKIWDVATGKEIQMLRGHASSVADVTFSSSEDAIASAGWDDTIRFWDAASRQEPRLLSHPGVAIRVTFSRDGRTLAIGSGAAVAVRDVSTGQTLWRKNDSLASRSGGTADVTTESNGLAYDPESRILAVGLASGEVRLRDAREGHVLWAFKAHDGPVMSLDFTPDGGVLASAGTDRKIALWDPADGRQIAVLKGHTDTINSVAFSPDGRFLASAGVEKEPILRLWDVSTGQQVRTFVGHEGAIFCVIFSHDGHRIFTGSNDHTIRVWNVETGRTDRVQSGHAGTVHSLSLSPDGRRMASSGNDRTVRVWDLATGQELQTLKPNAGNVYSVAFSPHGHLAAACSGSVVTVWDARPLTADVRVELVAADLLERMLPEVKTDAELLGRIREHSSRDEAIRRRALETAELSWQNEIKNRQRIAARQAFEEAKLLATNQDAKLRDPARAVLLARTTVDLLPEERAGWYMLGVASFRAGDWKGSIEAFEKSTKLNSSEFGDPYEWFVLAMAHWQLGEKDEALKWYDRAVALMEKDAFYNNNEELRRFRKEAEELLELSQVDAPSR